MNLLNSGIFLLSAFILTGCNFTALTPSSPQVLPSPLKPPVATLPLTPAPLVTSTPSPLPSSYLISAAFVPQAPQKNWDQPWQDACEEAALLTVHYYYQSKNPTIAEMLSDYQNIFSYETNQGWGHDVNLTQLSSVAASLGYQTQIINNPTLDQLKSFVSRDIPVIVPANGKTLYKENKHFKSGGPWYHQIVILGFDDSISKFTVHDVGTQFGANFKYSYSLLLESIHNWPSSGKKEDINLGEKSVLVLLK